MDLGCGLIGDKVGGVPRVLQVHPLLGNLKHKSRNLKHEKRSVIKIKQNL